jgi:hypothetical protein
VKNDAWRMPEDAVVILSHPSGFEWREYLGVVFVDVNSDGYVDIVRATGSEHYTYINTHSGWQKDPVWAMPDGNLANGSTQFGDLNADGLLDFLILDGSRRLAYLNNGSGWVRESALDPAQGNFSDGSTQLIDVNEDGFADLVIAGSSEKKTFLNLCYKGSHWQEVPSLALPEGDFGNYGTRLNDTTGKNVPDLLYNPNSERRVYRNKGKQIDYLTSIDNGLGGKVSVTYKSSVQFDNTGEDAISDLPFPIQVVDSVAVDDGRGSTYTTRYEYKDGNFDFPEREFRGFGYVKTIDPQGGFSESYFKQDNIYKGRPYLQQTKDASGKLYTKTQNTWDNRQVYSGVNFVSLKRSQSFTYDGQDSFKETAINFTYDDYGNPLEAVSEGDVSVSLDEKTQKTEYAYNTSDWIVSLPKRT